MEGASWVFDVSTGIWSVAESTQKKMRTMSAKNLAEQKAALFGEFLRSIK
jgi:hypothetical protein